MRSLPAFAEHLVVAVTAGQGVVAVAAEQEVSAAAPEEGVVAALAEELIGARTAEDRVVAGAAEQQGAGQRTVGFVERETVVAAQGEHLDLAGVRDRRLAARDGDGAAIDQNGPGRIAAGSDRVVVIVAEYAQQTRVRKEGGSDRHDISVLFERCSSRTRVSGELALADPRH